MTKRKDNVVKINQKKQLNVLERLMLLNLLPKEGSFANLKLLRVVREALSFSESENRALQFRTDVVNGQQMMAWNNQKVTNKATGELVRAPQQILQQMVQKDPAAFEVKPACPGKEIFFGEVLEGMVRKALADLDKAGKLVEDQFSLYEKFMEGHEDSGE